MALNTITIVKMPDGREIVIADWTDIPLYSSVDVLSGATNQQIDLFQMEAGRQVAFAANGTGLSVTPRTATTNDTNIATPGEMASDEEMLVYAIKPEVQSWTIGAGPSVDLADRTANGLGQPVPSLLMIAALQSTYLIQLEISQKLFAQAPFGYFNTGFGPYGVAELRPQSTNNPSLHTAINGWPSQDAVRSFVIPAHIGGQEKFRVSLINEPGTAVLLGQLEDNDGSPSNAATIMSTVRIVLDGLRKRPTA